MTANRVALAALATTLNDARIAANAIPETEASEGVYGEVQTALQSVIRLLVGEASPIHEEVIYQALLDGCTVREALQAGYCDLSEQELQTAEIMDLLNPSWG